MIILNKNIKLRVGGRKAPKLTIKEFIDLIKTKLHVDEFDSIWEIFDRLSVNESFYKDLSKIEFDTENVGSVDEFYRYTNDDFDYDIKYLDNNLPLLMTKSGVPYLACSAGGDWEVPIVFMIYWDGKKFRGYIPTKGNPFNSKLKQALNNDEDADNEFIHNEGYTDFDINDGPEGIAADIDMCIEDFESRISLI